MEERFIREKKELAYHAHIFDVYNDYLILPDGQKVIYDLIDHIPGCCVLPVDENGQLIFVRQYRNAVDDMTLEVPAGCMDKGETPEQCIRRELKEETGFTAEQLMFVTKTCLTIGTSNEMTYVYIATGLTHGEQMPDREEFIKLEKYSLEDTMQMIEDGKIIDSKTLIAIYAYANHVLKKQIRQGI